MSLSRNPLCRQGCHLGSAEGRVAGWDSCLVPSVGRNSVRHDPSVASLSPAPLLLHHLTSRSPALHIPLQAPCGETEWASREETHSVGGQVSAIQLLFPTGETIGRGPLRCEAEPSGGGLGRWESGRPSCPPDAALWASRDRAGASAPPVLCTVRGAVLSLSSGFPVRRPGARDSLFPSWSPGTVSF